MHLQLKIENKEKYSIAIQSLHIYMYALHLQSLTRGEKKIRVYDCRGDTLQGLMRLRKFHLVTYRRAHPFNLPAHPFNLSQIAFC